MSLESLRKTGINTRRILCLEVNPPRGVDCSAVFARLDGQLEGIDFLNVTDSALARMKLAPMPFAMLLKQRYQLEVLVNLSCRDRNLIALQADLLGGWATGVRSVVALTGDAVTVGDDPERKGVFEVNSVGLLSAVRTLNSGKDLVGNTLHGAPQFTAGVVVNPNARNVGAELRRLAKKKEAGACYALSQPVFDLEQATHFLREAASVGVPIMLGLLPFKSAEAAKAVNNIPGIKFPDELLEKITHGAAGDLSELSIAHCVALAQATKDLAGGFHVISGGAPKLALQLAQALRAAGI